MYQDLKELLSCCRLLFGDAVELSEDFLDYVREGGIKGAYRQRVRLIHPDIIQGTGRSHAHITADEFIKTQQAYERLLHFVREREKHTAVQVNITTDWQKKNETAPHRHREQKRKPSQSTPASGIRPFFISPAEITTSRIDRLYHGPLPQRQLLFGNFLYYGGFTNWRTITRVLTWQRLERPRLGELGKLMGLLTESEVSEVLNQQFSKKRPFGETAGDLGLLSTDQLRLLVTRQQRLQKKFGVILVEKELLLMKDLMTLLNYFKKHNQIVKNSL